MAGSATKRTPIVCHGHTRPIVELQYSNNTPDGFFLASASKDGLPMLRYGESGDWYGTFQGHKGAVWSCVLNQPALLCATGSADFTAAVWDACSGAQLHSFQHRHIVRTTAWSSGNRLATGGAENVVRIFDLDRPDAEPDKYAQQPKNIRCLQWLANDNLLLHSYTDKKDIAVYDTRTKEQVNTLVTDAPVQSIEFTFDGQYMTTAEGDAVRVWDAATLTQLKHHKLQKPNVESASYCPSKGVFVAGGADMWVRVYSYETGAELDCNKGHHGPVHAVRFAPTYDSYASGSEDGTIRIWYLDSGNGTTSNGNGAASA